jgi:hypothetical protein
MTGQPGYEAPVLTEIGTLDELTLLTINKIGPNADVLTGTVVVGTTIGPGSNITVTH